MTTLVPKKAIQDQAVYIMALAKRLQLAANNVSEDWHCRHSGTIANLCPELAKEASALRKMVRSAHHDQ